MFVVSEEVMGLFSVEEDGSMDVVIQCLVSPFRDFFC